MKVRDVLGMLMIAAGATVGSIRYQLLGLPVFLTAVALFGVGISLIWSAQRDSKMLDAASEVDGDWGTGDYASGSFATDDE